METRFDSKNHCYTFVVRGLLYVNIAMMLAAKPQEIRRNHNY